MKTMYKIQNYLGKEIGILPTMEDAELWRMHYEDMYNMSDLKIVEIQMPDDFGGKQ